MSVEMFLTMAGCKLLLYWGMWLNIFGFFLRNLSSTPHC
jgi:hypothetical protein